MNDTFGFLRAPRFWVMVIGAVALYLQAKGFIGEAEMVLIGTLTAGFVTVKTIDRAVDHTAEAKIIAASEPTITFEKV